jgi:hypothetical protein
MDDLLFQGSQQPLDDAIRFGFSDEGDARFGAGLLAVGVRSAAKFPISPGKPPSSA